jgi:actin-related protein
VLTKAPLDTQANREKMIQAQFETFNARLSTAPAGDGASHTPSIYQGYSLPHAIMRVNFAGRARLQKILNKRRYKFTTSAEREVVRDIKEKLTYVALCFGGDFHKAATTTNCDISHIRPDGNKGKSDCVRPLRGPSRPRRRQPRNRL